MLYLPDGTTFHVDVAADPTEPLTVSRAQAEDGYGWLTERIDTGVLSHVFAYEQTGGAMDVHVPATDRHTARGQLAKLLTTYPLLSTIEWRANKVIPLLDGFTLLYAAIDERRRIVVPQ